MGATKFKNPITFERAVTHTGDLNLAGATVTPPTAKPADAGGLFTLASYRVIVEDFEGVAGGTKPPHLTTDAQATGTADYVTGGLGQFRLGLTAADAAEAAQILGHEVDITDAPIIRWRVRVDGLGLDATGGEQLVVGLASAHANAEDSLDNVAVHAWFKVVATDNSILYESDDGTTDEAAADSGVDLADDTWVTLEIDATTLAAVAFKVNGAIVGTTDMSDATGVVRAFACIQRANNTGTEAARDLELDYYQIVVAR